MKKVRNCCLVLAGLFAVGIAAGSGAGATDAPQPVAPAAVKQPVTIDFGKKVKLDYTLTVNNQVIDSSYGKKPMEYTHGDGTMIPGLMAQLYGMRVGEEKTVVVNPEDAYGPYDPTATKEIPKSGLPPGFKPQLGMVLEVEAQDHTKFPATISEIKDQSVVLDFNHPLAGQTLTFKVKILSIE